MIYKNLNLKSPPFFPHDSHIYVYKKKKKKEEEEEEESFI